MRAVETGIGAIGQHLGVVRRQIVTFAERLYVTQQNIRLAYNHNALPRSVHAGLIQWRKIVDGRKVFRHKEVVRAGSICRSHLYGERLGSEVVEAGEPRHDIGQGLGNRGFGGVREVRFAANLEVMDRCLQRFRNLRRGAAEGDPVTRPSAFLHVEALGRKPCHDLRVIAHAQSEAVTKLFRSEPFVELRRRGVLLIRQQTVQVRLLCRGRLDH